MFHFQITPMNDDDDDDDDVQWFNVYVKADSKPHSAKVKTDMPEKNEKQLEWGDNKNVIKNSKRILNTIAVCEICSKARSSTVCFCASVNNSIGKKFSTVIYLRKNIVHDTGIPRYFMASSVIYNLFKNSKNGQKDKDIARYTHCRLQHSRVFISSNRAVQQRRDHTACSATL